MEFRDLKKQYNALKDTIDLRIKETIEGAHFISGPQVKELESKLAEYVGVKHCISCANGTDALTIALMTWKVGEGDAIFVPDFTFFSSGECVSFVGATPIFVDVLADTYNIDPCKLEKAIVQVLEKGELKPKAVIAVDLFGLPADYKEIKAICNKYNLLLLEDGAQGFGGSIKEKKACSFGDISTTSFFPAKPLGCYGDGGAIFTDNDEWAKIIRSICVHGKDTTNPNNPEAKYNNIRIGMNSRLDTLQAAVLLPKLEAFCQYELYDVNRVAEWYSELLKGTDIIIPYIPDGYTSSWAQYTVQLPTYKDRENVQNSMKDAGIPTAIYYIKPMHRQEAFKNTFSEMADCNITEKLCSTVLSLPMHPYLSKEEVELVANALLESI